MESHHEFDLRAKEERPMQIPVPIENRHYGLSFAKKSTAHDSGDDGESSSGKRLVAIEFDADTLASVPGIVKVFPFVEMNPTSHNFFTALSFLEKTKR